MTQTQEWLENMLREHGKLPEGKATPRLAVMRSNQSSNSKEGKKAATRAASKRIVLNH